MIPASYMFKDTYHQHWEHAGVVTQPTRQSGFSGGLGTPIQHLIKAMLHRTAKPARYHVGVHAYD